ncbi:MAG: hypothetical protein EOP06_20350, partial [Proteobacteria bacterium]
ADDITFSTNLRRFKAPILAAGSQPEDDEIEIGADLDRIITTNGFSINKSKTRVQRRYQHQEVTGLTVNRIVNVNRKYIREIRGALHAWEKFGYANAQLEFTKSYRSAQSRKALPGKDLGRVLKGRIDFVGYTKGRNNPLFINFILKLHDLNPELFSPKERREKINPFKSIVRKIEENLWVVESAQTCEQGSAFALDMIGLVTCSHCLHDDSVIFHPGDLKTKIPVKVIARSQALDVAIIENPRATHYTGLYPADAELAKVLDSVILAGFPNYQEHDKATIIGSNVASFRRITTFRNILLDRGIVAGNSGGPLLTTDGRVLGIAQRGTVDRLESSDTEKHVVIPIDAVYKVAADGTDI